MVVLRKSFLLDDERNEIYLKFAIELKEYGLEDDIIWRINKYKNKFVFYTFFSEGVKYSNFLGFSG